MNDLVKIGYDTQKAADLTSAANARIMAVGDVNVWRRSGGKMPRYRDLCFRSIEDVTQEALQVLRPDLIVSPAVTPQFDCLDVAQKLADLRYQGSYRALARNVARPEMIRSEVRGFCPDLDFDIIVIPEADVHVL